MIEEPGADIQAEPEGQAGPPECYPSAGAQHPKETECSGQDSGGSIFSVTSYRKTQMNFLANPIHCYIWLNPTFSRKNMIYKKEKDPNA